MRKIIGALAVWLALCSAALAQTCPGLPFTFTANTTARSAQVNSNFLSLLNCQNTLLAPLASPVFTGNITIPTLNVTGTETVGSTLGVTGATTHSGLVTMSGAAVNEAFATIASAATTNIGAAAANYLQVTGTTGITAFDTIQAGSERTLEFTGALTLTFNATSLILPQAANITTQAGDVFKFRSEGSGNWRAVAWPSRFATKAIMQAAADNVAVVTPAQVQNHPGAAKAWVQFVGSTVVVSASYNISSVTRNGAGDYTLHFSTPFATANYSCAANAGNGSAAGAFIATGPQTTNPTASAYEFLTFGISNTGNPFTGSDPAFVQVACYGAQ